MKRLSAFEALAVDPAYLPDRNPITAVETNPTAGTAYWLKDLIFGGDYEHPSKGWKLNVDRPRMDKWVDTFNAMQKNGVKIPIYADHNPAAGATLGYVSSIARGGTPQAMALQARRGADESQKALDPDTLYAVCSFSDAECQKLANRVKQVSINIDKDAKDGSGNEYGEAITHVAVTPEPVVNSQSDFERLAASKLTRSASSFVLTSETENTGAVLTMSKAKDDNAEEFESVKEALSKHLGADHEEIKALTPDNAMATMKRHFCAMAKAHADMAKAIDAHKMAASKAAPEMTPTEMNLSVKFADNQLGTLVKEGKITPAVSKALSVILVGEKDKRNTYALSCSADGADSLAMKVLEALQGNDPVQLGEVTRLQSQTVSLSRVVPGSTKTPEQAKEDEAFEARRQERLKSKK